MMQSGQELREAVRVGVSEGQVSAAEVSYTPQPFTVSQDETLYFPEGRVAAVTDLTVESGATFIVDGTLNVFGTITETGTITGTGTVNSRSL